MLPTCPQCHLSGFVKRSHRSLVEKALSPLKVFPFRCSACGRRFYRTMKPLLNEKSSLQANGPAK
jgi:hypothetical protein